MSNSQRPQDNPNAIEEIVFKPLKSAKKIALTEESSGMLAKLVLGGKAPFKSIEEAEKPFLYKVIERRVEVCHDFKFVDNRAILFLCLNCDSLGDAQLFIWFIQGICKEQGQAEVDLDFLCQWVFPFGFPSKEELIRIWDAQKVERDGLNSDNLIDYLYAGKSLLLNN